MSNTTFFFVLGSHPAISATEILQHARTLNIPIVDVQASREVLLFTTSSPIEPRQWQQRLGGTIKIGSIATTVARKELTPDGIAQAYCSQPQKIGKNTIGVSAYALSGNAPQVDRRFSMQFKSDLREQGVSVRVVTNEGKPLTSVQVATQKLLTKGAEIVLIARNAEVLVGYTESIQDFEEFGERDYGRPGRDSRSGMLPPKLARMMINVAGVTQHATLLDPFCGSGTVLTEALELGVRSLYGSDINRRAVADTERNIEWMRKHLRELGAADDTPAHITAHDATEPFSCDHITHVVTELYLGPAHLPSGEAFEKMFREIETLFAQSLMNIAAVLTPEGTAVLAIPLFRRNETWRYLYIDSAIKKSGLTLRKPLPHELQAIFQKDLTTRGNLAYARKDATVGRELLLLSR